MWYCINSPICPKILSLIEAASEFGANTGAAASFKSCISDTQTQSSCIGAMANNYNKFFEEMSEQDMGVIGNAVSEIQENCDFCRQGVTELLRSIAKDLIICGQITGACRRLTEKETTPEDKAARLALMATKREDIMQWNDLFHSRSRGVCRLCQLNTQECVAIWKLGKRL